MYTPRIGVLDESYLGTGRPLGESRLLFEIGRFGGSATIRELRERLDLDSGYVSRLLAQLRSSGLVTQEDDPRDRRRRIARLTEHGREVVGELERRSEDLAEGLLAPLTAHQRARLAGALATADLLLRAATVRIEPIPLEAPLAQEAVARYVAEIAERFPAGFDPKPSEPHGAGGEYLVATSEGRPVAFGGFHPVPIAAGDARVQAAEIKRLWVDPTWRGAGLGARMLAEIESRARDLGLRRAVLDTNTRLPEAIGLYEKFGYRRIGRYNANPYPDRFYAKDL